VNVSTRFIEYRPGYNEIESGSTWYDNSVLYLDEADSNRPAVIIEDQNILVDNDTIRLTAVQNQFSVSGTRKIAVEFYPTTNATNLSNLNGTLDIRIPTRLGSGDGYWNESIENGSITYQGIDDAAYPSSSEVSALLLRADSPDNVTVNSVGIQSEPTGETVKDNVGPAGGGGNNGENGNNGPSAPLFDTLEADQSQSRGDRFVTFTWSVSGQFSQITFETPPESISRTARSGSVTLDTQSGNRMISAVVNGPGGSEDCEATIGNGDSLNKNDFTCTTTST
jgi:hypothetical protein